MAGRKRRRIPIVLIVALVLCLGMVIFCGSQLAGIFLEYKEGTDEYDDLQKYVEAEPPQVAYGEEADSQEGQEGERRLRIDLEGLRAQNEDVVGWIEIPDTEISYPLMQGDDDQYYLKHTFSGNKNSAGSIFIETLNKPDLTELHTIIYGHNMKNGSMFGSLKEYRNASYLLDHPMVYIDLEDGTHVYEIFSCYETAANSDTYTIGFAREPDQQYERFVAMIKDRSLYDTGVEVSKENRVITLSTCTKSGEKRFVVHAKRCY